MLPPKTRAQHLLLAGLMGLVAFLAGLPGINRIDFSHDNEAYYILGAQEMLETGNYVCPLYLGRIHLDKPPPYYWLVALGYKVFGVSLFCARLPSLLAGALTVFLVYWLALWLFECPRSACFSCLAMMSLFVVYRYSRLSMTDLWMTLGTLIGIFFFARGAVSGRPILNFFIASLGVGLAGLMKGHVGIVVASFPILAFFVLSWRTPARIPVRYLVVPTTWLPALLLTGWWYLFLFTCQQPASEFSGLYGPSDPTLSAIAKEFFTGEVEERSLGGMTFFLQNILKYLGYVLVDYGPWSWCVLLGFFAGKRPLRQDWKKEPRKMLALFATILSILVLFVILIRARRNARYLLPLAPALAVLAGRYLDHWVDAARSKRGLVPFAAAALLILLFNGVFNLGKPYLRGRPLQELCDFLKPQLKASDQIFFYEVDDARFAKKHALAMGTLGHRTRYKKSPPEKFLAQARGLSAEGAPGAIYVFTTDSAWEAFSPEQRQSWQVLKEANLYAKWRSLRQVRDRLNNRAERRLLLLKALPPQSSGPMSRR